MSTKWGQASKRKKEFGSKDSRTVAVKSTLNSLIRTEKDRRQLIPLIKRQAENVSKALFLYQRDLDNARYHREAFLRFCRERKGVDGFPDLTNCNALKINQANQYEISFLENIKRNYRHCIVLYYRFLVQNPMSERAAQIHVGKLCSVKDALNDDRWDVEIDDRLLTLANIVDEKRFFLLIPALIRLNRRIRTEHLRCESEQPKSIPKDLKTFNVVAQKQWGTKYVTYDTGAVIQLLNLRAKERNKANKDRKDGVTAKKFKILQEKNADARKIFKNVFKIERWERTDAKGPKCRIGFWISTDGVGASIGLERRIDVKEVRSRRNFLKNHEI